MILKLVTSGGEYRINTDSVDIISFEHDKKPESKILEYIFKIQFNNGKVFELNGEQALQANTCVKKQMP